MSLAKTAATKIDWVGLTSKLRPETVNALSAFRRRHTELTATLDALQNGKKDIDFDSYRATLQNKAVVDEAEMALRYFVPQKFTGLEEQLRIIDEQEAKAVALAKKTAEKVGVELVELNELLKNIETARPIDDLTVEDVVRAKPELLGKVQKMLERQQYGLPAYLDRFGQTGVGF